MAGEQFGHTDSLDGLAQAHIVGQYGPADSGGKGDAVHLVWPQFGFQQGFAQGMGRGIPANLGRHCRHALLKQLLLNECFCIRVDRHRDALAFHPADALQQVLGVVNSLVLQWRQQGLYWHLQLLG